MDVKEVKHKRIELEHDIKRLLEDFTRETDVVVHSVSCPTIEQMDGANLRYFVSVDLVLR